MSKNLTEENIVHIKRKGSNSNFFSQVRLEERLKPHINNTVWEKRDSPPPDWNKPLPDYLLERQKNSYLAMYAANQEKLDNASSTELKLMEVKAKAVNTMSCAIM